MHKLWLNITTDPKFAGAHHYHIVALALEELQRELSTEQRPPKLLRRCKSCKKFRGAK
jgi:hypothetical protein